MGKCRISEDVPALLVYKRKKKKKLIWVLKRSSVKSYQKKKRVGNTCHIIPFPTMKLMKLLQNNLISGKLMLTSRGLKVKIRKNKRRKERKIKLSTNLVRRNILSALSTEFFYAKNWARVLLVVSRNSSHY